MAAFELRISNYLFAPNLVPLLLTLLVIPILMSLGLWQLDRADEKRFTDNAIKEAIVKPALKLNEYGDKDIAKVIYRKVDINGNYDSQNQLLLDNRTHLGKPGYHVISPFVFKDKSEQHAILVNRGWVGYQGTRDNIPDIKIDETKRTITGSVKAISDAIVLSKEKELNEHVVMTESNYKLIQSIQVQPLEDTLGYKLLPVVIELSSSEKQGFTREWQPYYGSIDKHNAYALQWFAMALIVLFLFIKLNIKRLNIS